MAMARFANCTRSGPLRPRDYISAIPPRKLFSNQLRKSFWVSVFMFTCYDNPVLDHRCRMIDPKEVRYLTIVRTIVDCYVGLLARLKRTDQRLATDTAGAVDRSGADCLRRSHSHLRAGDGQDHLHRRRRRTAGIEVSRKCNRYSRIDQRARRRVQTQPEVEHRAR